jgi:hypothetical protein
MFRHKRTGQPAKPLLRSTPLPAERESTVQPWQPPTTQQLSRAQLQDQLDWSDPEPRQLPALRPSSYVPASSQVVSVPAANIANPNVGITAEITPASIVEAKTIGSHNDRARAWLKYAFPLSAITAAGMTIAAVALNAVPLLSAWVLVVYLITFALVYLPGMIIYWLITPEGVALLHTLRLWGYLLREQRHRHTIERELYREQMDANRRRLGGGK